MNDEIKNIDIFSSFDSNILNAILNNDLHIDSNHVLKAYTDYFESFKNKILIYVPESDRHCTTLIKFGNSIFDKVEIIRFYFIKSEICNNYGLIHSNNEVSYHEYNNFILYYSKGSVYHIDKYKDSTIEEWNKYYNKYLKIKNIYEEIYLEE